MRCRCALAIGLAVVVLCAAAPQQAADRPAFLIESDATPEQDWEGEQVDAWAARAMEFLDAGVEGDPHREEACARLVSLLEWLLAGKPHRLLGRRIDQYLEEFPDGALRDEMEWKQVYWRTTVYEYPSEHAEGPLAAARVYGRFARQHPGSRMIDKVKLEAARGWYNAVVMIVDDPDLNVRYGLPDVTEFKARALTLLDDIVDSANSRIRSEARSMRDFLVAHEGMSRSGFKALEPGASRERPRVVPVGRGPGGAPDLAFSPGGGLTWLGGQTLAHAFTVGLPAAIDRQEDRAKLTWIFEGLRKTGPTSGKNGCFDFAPVDAHPNLLHPFEREPNLLRSLRGGGLIALGTIVSSQSGMYMATPHVLLGIRVDEWLRPGDLGQAPVIYAPYPAPVVEIAGHLACNTTSRHMPPAPGVGTRVLVHQAEADYWPIETFVRGAGLVYERDGLAVGWEGFGEGTEGWGELRFDELLEQARRIVAEP